MSWRESVRGFLARRIGRVPVGIVVLSVLAALVGTAYMLTGRASYAPLYPRLTERAGGEVINALERMGVRYRVAEESGQIEVPADLAQLTRYRLAALGLPRDETIPAPESGLGSLGLNPAETRQRLQHALEAELAVSLARLPGVAAARVHLAIPRSSPFAREPAAPSAAAILNLDAGETLSQERVEAVRAILGAGVPGLAPESISVVMGEPAAAPMRAAAAPRPRAAGQQPAAGLVHPLWLAVAALAGGGLGFALRMRVGQRRPLPPANPPEPASQLDRVRTQALAEPARAADVIKLWLRT